MRCSRSPCRPLSCADPQSHTDDLVGAKPTLLRAGSAVDLRPKWNLDGASVVFESQTNSGSELWLLRLPADPAGMRAATHQSGSG